MTFKLNLQSIVPGNDSLMFLEKRISNNNYRGVHKSQHNRYTFDDIVTILKTLYSITKDQLMVIRDRDLSKRSYNTPEEKNYSIFVNEVYKKMNRGTQDSIRKTLFVDFNRMGFIKRFDSKKREILPYSRGHVKYVSISDSGLALINDNSTIFEKRLIFSKGLNNLFSNFLDELLSVIISLDKNKFDIYEYTFFISFIGCKLINGVYSRSDVIKLVKSYNALSKFQKDAVVSYLRTNMKPKNFKNGNKKNKRDFNNWINESQQIFSLLDQTVYFEKLNNEIHPRFGKTGVFVNKQKFKRSQIEIEKYYKIHNIAKKPGFELHHIVPLLSSNSRDEWYLLDNHLNMAYIDGYKHSIITQKKSKHIILSFDKDDAVFSAYDKNLGKIICKNNINIIYDTAKRNDMLDYNSKILKGITK